MEKQEFIEKYNFVKESVISAMDKALERALENEVIDLSKCDGNYLDVYPLIGAVLKRELSYILDGSPTYSRSIKRKATKYNYLTIIEYGTIMLEIININKYYLQ